MRSLRRLSVVLGLFAALGVSAVALAKDKKGEKTDEKPEKAEKPEKKDDKPAASKGISEYDKQLIEAHKAFAAGVAGGALEDAIAGYRKAIATDPSRPEGHLFLAGALYQKADYAAADEALTQAVNRAKADKLYANYLGKALMLQATNAEVSGKPTEALAAWKAYDEFAKANPDAVYPEGSGAAPPVALKSHPGSALERQAKLEAYAKSIGEYAKVKELILKRQKELGIDPNAKPVTSTDKK
jgi:tetratricopeptide (TPR) repeat protein